jgi:CysZ protein
MILSPALAAARQVVSRPLRRVLLRSLGLTLVFLGLIWAGLTALARHLVQTYPLGQDHPYLEGAAVFLAGAGLFLGLAYILPAVSALVAGFFLDEVADAVERSDFPRDPPGVPLSLGRSIALGLRFAALTLLLNIGAFALLLVPGINLFAFFAVNAYLLGREYFEMAAARFGTPESAAALRRAHWPLAMAGGVVTAALLLVPILNLATPIFGVALFVHIHKRIARRQARALEAGPTAARIGG